eukprot:3443332-Amphidinium_carterae.1
MFLGFHAFHNKWITFRALLGEAWMYKAATSVRNILATKLSARHMLHCALERWRESYCPLEHQLSPLLINQPRRMVSAFELWTSLKGSRNGQDD